MNRSQASSWTVGAALLGACVRLDLCACAGAAGAKPKNAAEGWQEATALVHSVGAH